jgi:hypothetical protein
LRKNSDTTPGEAASGSLLPSTAGARLQMLDVDARRLRVAHAIGALHAGVLRRERPGSPNTRLARFGNSARSW